MSNKHKKRKRGSDESENSIDNIEQVDEKKMNKMENSDVQTKVNIDKSTIGETIPREYLQIYRVLSDEPIHINELAKRLGKPIQEVNPVITMMEIEGYAYQPQPNYFMRNIT